MADSFDMTTLFLSYGAPRFQNQSFPEFMNCGEKNGMCRREYDREDSKCKEKNRSLPTECFLNNSSVASHSCEENIGFAEKRDHISIKSKAF